MKTMMWDEKLITAIALLIVLAIILCSCCTPSNTQISTSKSDTIWVTKTVIDSSRVAFNPTTTIIDTTKWWLQNPTVEIHDTILVEGNTKYIIKYKRVQTDSGASHIEMNLSHERKDSIPVVTKTVNTAVYERYQRPWWEWFVMMGVVMVSIAVGFGIGRIKR
jgi:hypothetical protein